MASNILNVNNSLRAECSCKNENKVHSLSFRDTETGIDNIMSVDDFVTHRAWPLTHSPAPNPSNASYMRR